MPNGFAPGARGWGTIARTPTAFDERARPVLQWDATAHARLQAGTWVVCVDETTSIQAREAEQPPQPPQPHHLLRQSPRSHRRGALPLVAGVRVVAGQVVGRGAGRQRFVDFQVLLAQGLVPEARRRGVQRVALVLDNGSTHAPKQVERWVQEQAQDQDWGVTVQVSWLPTHASWLDQLEIWFSVLQRTLLPPNHFTSPTDLEQAMLAFIAYSNQTATPIQWSSTVEKLERKLGMH